VRVLSISRREAEPGRTTYFLTVEGMASPAKMVVDETTDPRLYERDELTELFGKGGAAWLNRLVADYHDGSRPTFPVEIPDD
jgi:hypothetical protein